MGILTTDEAMERALKQTPVHLDLRRFEHARIDAGLSKQTVAARIGWHPNSLANLLTRARQGRPVRLATIILIASVLQVEPYHLVTLLASDEG